MIPRITAVKKEIIVFFKMPVARKFMVKTLFLHFTLLLYFVCVVPVFLVTFFVGLFFEGLRALCALITAGFEKIWDSFIRPMKKLDERITNTYLDLHKIVPPGDIAKVLHKPSEKGAGG